MKKLLFVTASITLLALPVYAETVGEKTGVNSTLGIAPTTQDFVNKSRGCQRYVREPVDQDSLL